MNKIESRPCPICYSNNSDTNFKNIFDDRFGCPIVTDSVKCTDCGHYFVSPNLDDSVLTSLYETYYGRESAGVEKIVFKLPSRFRRWFMGENNLGQFNVIGTENNKLLDVGSGSCESLWQASQLGFDSFGFDVDRTSGDIAEKLGLRVAVASTISDAYPDTLFSWIQLNQVIEHFIDPVEQLSMLVKHLEKDGYVFLSTPNANSISRRICGRNWINWHVPYHQHHFTLKSLQLLAITSGLEVIAYKTVTPIVWVLLQRRHTRSDVKLGIPNPIWSSSATGPRRRRDSDALDFLFLMCIFPLVKIVDLLKQGDCQIIILRKNQ